MLGFPVSIHDLRGSHATMLLDAGEKPHVVAARLPEEPSGMSAMLRVNCPKWVEMVATCSLGSSRNMAAMPSSSIGSMN